MKVYTNNDYGTPALPYVRFMRSNLGWYDSDNVTYPRSVKVRFTQNGSGKTQEIILFQQQYNPHGGNLYYQHGRKDPMLGSTETLDGDHAQFPTSTANSWQISPEFTRVSLGTAIQHPNIFYMNTQAGASDLRTYCSDGYYYYGWCTNRYDNLWCPYGKFNTDVAVQKTVYDPCPAGYKIPNKCAFSGLHSLLPATEWNFGIDFRSLTAEGERLFFASTSLREHDAGNVRQWFISAFCQTAGLGHASWSTDEEKCMSVCYLQVNEPSEDGHNPMAGAPVLTGIAQAGSQCYGFSVCPIADED